MKLIAGANDGMPIYTRLAFRAPAIFFADSGRITFAQMHLFRA